MCRSRRGVPVGVDQPERGEGGQIARLLVPATVVVPDLSRFDFNIFRRIFFPARNRAPKTRDTHTKGSHFPESFLLYFLRHPRRDPLAIRAAGNQRSRASGAGVRERERERGRYFKVTKAPAYATLPKSCHKVGLESSSTRSSFPADYPKPVPLAVIR